MLLVPSTAKPSGHLLLPLPLHNDRHSFDVVIGKVMNYTLVLVVESWRKFAIAKITLVNMQQTQ